MLGELKGTVSQSQFEYCASIEILTQLLAHFTMHWGLSIVFSYDIPAVFTSSLALRKFDLQIKLYMKLFEGSFSKITE